MEAKLEAMKQTAKGDLGTQLDNAASLISTGFTPSLPPLHWSLLFPFPLPFSFSLFPMGKGKTGVPRS